MAHLLLKLSVIQQSVETIFQKFYEFNGSGIFYKMRENFPSMRVSVRMYQIACVSRRMRETWKVCYLDVIVYMK